ncbi:uncharacterized protein KD926_005349 [Aspergillus affinis]|uniref:uncharacterized protein n=1 Tax=Aspergillus affinis TaxID=1070780 RepID=UPI0022FEEEB7|nr:uncharacterized protein KD926_005349 [Aspergillus affinis]KAI9034816.1 hypothetical protein KD926_005349 [Aspergillus affinis]
MTDKIQKMGNQPSTDSTDIDQAIGNVKQNIDKAIDDAKRDIDQAMDDTLRNLDRVFYDVEWNMRALRRDTERFHVIINEKCDGVRCKDYLQWDIETLHTHGITLKEIKETLGRQGIYYFSQEETDKWLHVRTRSFLSYINTIQQNISSHRKELTFKGYILDNGPDIAADAQLFLDNDVKEYDVFEAVYSYPFFVAQRLVTDNLRFAIHILEVKVRRELDCEESYSDDQDFSIGQEEALVQLKSCLKQIDPDSPIPAEEVTKLRNLCDIFDAAAEV